MRTAVRWALLASALMIVVAMGTWAAGQETGQGQGQQQPPPPPAKEPAQPGTPAAPAGPTPEELAEQKEFKTFFDLKDAQSQATAGESFLKKYPESRYRAAVYSRLSGAYRQLNEADKMFIAGEKALELNPDDVGVLLTMAATIPRRWNPDDLGADQKLDRAEGYANRANALIEKSVKPETATDEQFMTAKNQGFATVHGALGLIHFRRGRYADMVVELEKATQLLPDPEPLDLYLLGIGYSQVKRHSDAVTAFERCAAVDSSFKADCQKSIGEAKKAAAAQPAPPKQQQ
jgi:tetratricopeptide (TPR) repeat protein